MAIAISLPLHLFRCRDRYINNNKDIYYKELAHEEAKKSQDVQLAG